MVLVESYVDESQYRGTCYRACGFEAVGLTAGYGRSSRDYYLEHGQPKQLYLRELRPRAMGILRQGRLPADLAEQEEKISGPCPLRASHLRSLLEVFEQCKDRRRGHGLRHPQAFVLACAAVAMLMGAGGYEAFEDECKKLTQRQLRALGCRPDPKTGRYRPPSDSTFFRVMNGTGCRRFRPAHRTVDDGAGDFHPPRPGRGWQVSARQCPHRWQTTAVALGGQPPLAPDGGPGTHPGKEQ